MQYAALEQRVHGLADAVSGVQRDVSELRSALFTKIDAITESLSTRGRPQWQVIFTGLGVVSSIMIAIGALAYRPIVEDMHEIKALLGNGHYVSQSELILRKELVDENIAELRTRLNRIEEAYVSSFTPRDAIDSLKRRLDRLQSTE